MALTPEELLAKLDGLGFEAVTARHPPLYTVADSQKLRGEIPGRHTKNLFLKDKKGQYFLVTVGEDRAVDLKGLHKILGASGRLSFGNPDRLMEYLGVEPGAVTAFAVINDTGGMVKAVIDNELMQHEKLNAHPLTNEATTTIRRDDLVAFMTAAGHPPAVLDVSERPQNGSI